MRAKKQLKGYLGAAVTLLYGFIGEAQATGIPTLSGPADGSNDPFEGLVSLFKWAITIVVFVMLAMIFITVMKNGWQKYHQLGEEGSKVTWRDLGANLIAGAVIIALGVIMGNYAIDILGKSSV